jgi:ankyrin repeat protein
MLRAAKGLDAPAIRLLLEAGARIDIPTSRGAVPFPTAAGLGSRIGDTRGWFVTSDVQERSIAALSSLIEAGADPNSTDRQGQSALHGAATWGWNDVITYLVQQGADINITDARGITPLDVSMGRGGGRGGGEVRPETAALIESLGGRAGTPVEAGGPGLPPPR